MKIGMAQVNPTVGDLEGNVMICRDAIRRLGAGGANLAILPEMVIPGYPARDILFDGSFIEACEVALQDLASQTRNDPPAIVGSLAHSDARLPGHPGLYNAAYLLQGGNATVVATKRLLPGYDVYFEPRWFVPGSPAKPFELAGHSLGVMICEDMWDEGYPIHPGAELVGQGAELLVCISASPFRKNKADSRLRHARRQAQTLAYVNLCGANDELIFDGRSFVMGADGSVLEQFPAFREHQSVIDLDACTPAQMQETNPAGGRFEDERFAGELIEALKLGIADFMAKNGLRRIFVGASGGVDSSVALVLACMAVGPGNVTAVAIPSRHTDPRSTECAGQLAHNLGANFVIKDLESLHRAAENSLASLVDRDGVAENLQARLRMLVLMAHVNRYGGILLNTSNKTELSLGYSTLYGDMSGALSPLGDLTKLEVYRLARWINANYHEIIPNYAIERPPSAELKPGQVDPFDYAQVSPELDALVLGQNSNHALRVSEHKRRQMGIILKVSETAFGSGRMVPVTRK